MRAQTHLYNRVCGLSLIELLVAVGAALVLLGMLFPIAAKTLELGKRSNAGNLRKLARGATLYGDDYEERIPILINGPWRNLRNVRDGDLTQYGNQRTDAWPLLIRPYIKERSTYVDPERSDPTGVWSGPALASADAGFVATKNTYRNQNMHPFFGVNYMFLSPMLIPASKMADTTPTDFAVGEPRRFFQATEPAATVFYVPTKNWDSAVGPGAGEARGYFAVNAPGLSFLGASSVPYVLLGWGDGHCAGDWCGTDVDPEKPGVQTSQAQFYANPSRNGNNVVFLDGHARFMATLALAAGTNYLSARPTDNVSNGGSQIVDRGKYLWNLDNMYYMGE